MGTKKRRIEFYGHINDTTTIFSASNHTVAALLPQFFSKIKSVTIFKKKKKGSHNQITPNLTSLAKLISFIL